MDKFHRNKTAIRIKVISMGNAEAGKVLRRTIDFVFGNTLLFYHSIVGKSLHMFTNV